MYADMGSPRCEPFSKLKYGVVNPPFIYNMIFYHLIIFLPTVWNFRQNQISLKYLIENLDLKNEKFFYISTVIR